MVQICSGSLTPHFWHDENHHPSKRESSLFRSSTNVVGWRKPCSNNEQLLRRPHALHTLKPRKRTQSCKKRPIRTSWMRFDLWKQNLLPTRQWILTRNVRKKGELSCRTKPTKRPHQMWILWKSRPPWRGVLKEEEWVNFYKLATHQSCHLLRIWQIWWIVRNEI